jgi:hypothetical protein
MLTQTSRLAKTLTLDYDQYAEAEARLGWLNAQGSLHSQQPFAVKHWVTHFLRLLDSALTAQEAAIAHVKVQAATATTACKASLTQSGGAITWDGEPDTQQTDRLDFVLNARVHTTPTRLEQAVRWAFVEVTPPPTFRYEFADFACFSPAPPQPTHRLVTPISTR